MRYDILRMLIIKLRTCFQDIGIASQDEEQTEKEKWINFLAIEGVPIDSK